MGQVFRMNGVEDTGDIVMAGKPADVAPDPLALAVQLSDLMQNLITAQNRLINMVDVVAAGEQVKLLSARFGELQAKITGLLKRLQDMAAANRPDAYAMLIRDYDNTAIEVQGFIEAVEEQIGKHPKAGVNVGSGGGGVSPSAGTPPSGASLTAAQLAERKRKIMPYVVLGGMAVLIAGGGYLLWAQKNKQDKAHQRASRKAFGALPARGGKGR